MADTPSPAKKTPAKSAKGATTKSDGPTKVASRKTAATAAAAAPDAEPAAVAAPSPKVIEAKSRFNAALEEAKAGAAALRAEAETRITTVGGQARGKGDDLVSEAKAYGEQALGRAGELAVEGKKVTSDAIASLGKVVGDTAAQIDEKLGVQYGDYARKASRTLQETSAKLDAKSVEELGEDAREMVRKSPAAAVGIAAVFGFFLARVFSGGKKR
ncbi:hypothetical protein ACLBKU_08870 [Erythrobacter sp. NE805]|uniref:hypothetical protein n=1 Tax=Erythrobacter sp. NE805 TaxID=3389875 RepID=UPI00396B18C5